MNFTKMHGIGNDYVYVDCTKRELKKPEEIARFVSDRHFGIGSDGLILIKRSEVADFYMDMYNADGSKGEMCGNGIRCVAKYVYDYGLTDKKELTIETLAGIKELVLTIEEDKVAKVRVNMGAPILAPEKIPVLASKEPVVKEPIVVDDKEWEMTCVSVGNPHAIVFLEEPVSTFPIEKVGPSFEHHKRFPNRINTEFVEVINRDRIKMRVWERGANETFACGTGACASVVAAILNGYCNKKVTVELLGGELEIEWKDADNGIYMTGSATTVFDGQITLPEGLE
ncbi:MAG: diaminopimelate epimerase [Lachnospiraceae bacterium]|jgi:diaminopimelate epimerase|nr:diaminopimelate epimerase [Lachnospiraceae bacterium]MDE7057216.1 diaminopimelate epimerase [Lachnospiraceae bacterium]